MYYVTEQENDFGVIEFVIFDEDNYEVSRTSSFEIAHLLCQTYNL